MFESKIIKFVGKKDGRVYTTVKGFSDSEVLGTMLDNLFILSDVIAKHHDTDCHHKDGDCNIVNTATRIKGLLNEFRDQQQMFYKAQKGQWL